MNKLYTATLTNRHQVLFEVSACESEQDAREQLLEFSRDCGYDPDNWWNRLWQRITVKEKVSAANY